MKYIIAYTDGSILLKEKRGGTAFYLEFKDGENILGTTSFSKGYVNTTISRMEMYGIIFALSKIQEKQKYKVLIVSDSEFVVNSINKGWVSNWEKEKFLDRPNSDLWIRFLEEYRKFPKENLTFKHTRGHGKGLLCYQKGNDIVDRLCSYKVQTSFEEDVLCPYRAQVLEEKIKNLEEKYSKK